MKKQVKKSAIKKQTITKPTTGALEKQSKALTENLKKAATTKKSQFIVGDVFKITEITNLGESAVSEFVEIAQEHGSFLYDPNFHIVQPIYLEKVKDKELKALYQEYKSFGWDYLGVSENDV